MSSRYLTGTQCPRPIMKIIPSSTDILHPLKMGERIDTLAQKYYSDQTEGWIIMCANREYSNEFEIPFGTLVRVPFPLSRVFTAWQLSNDL